MNFINKNSDFFTYRSEKEGIDPSSLMPILHKVIKKTQELGTLPNSFYEASVTLILKLDKVLQENKY